MKGTGLTSAREARGSGRRLRLPGTQRRTAALLAEPERVSGQGPVLPLRGALPCTRARSFGRPAGGKTPRLSGLPGVYCPAKEWRSTRGVATGRVLSVERLGLGFEERAAGEFGSGLGLGVKSLKLLQRELGLRVGGPLKLESSPQWAPLKSQEEGK